MNILITHMPLKHLRLPKNLGLLSQLQSISMEGNKLSFVRQDIIKGGTDRMMKYLRDRITEEVVCDARLNEDNWPDKYGFFFLIFCIPSLTVYPGSTSKLIF